MKTETLIELQRSITQGEWSCNYGNGTNLTNDVTIWGDAGRVVIGELVEDLSFPMVSATSEMPANARAIALVPELIAEVIRLREALKGCADALYRENVAYGLSPSLSDAFNTARAALANDK